MTPSEALRAYAEALPRGTVVPVLRELVLELLAGASGDGPVPVQTPADLTVAEVARRFGRAPATVRGWCEEGRLPGAYRFRGKEWRVPQSALEAFEAGERGRALPPMNLSTAPRALDRILKGGRR